jgi:putative transposase
MMAYMCSPKCQDVDYINFLVATPVSFSCTEAAAVQPDSPSAPAHDAFTRLLHRLQTDPGILWREARPMVDRARGVLVVDDSTLDKPYAKKIELVNRHWSGKHHAVVQGINLITMLWTDGDRNIPCDYRIYDRPVDGLTENDHFLAMLDVAKARGFAPRYVLFDGWYSGLENLKSVRAHGWSWLTRLKANRLVNLDRQGQRAVNATAISASGTTVYLQGFGLILVFKIVAPDGDIAYWATDDLGMDESIRLQNAELS